MSDGIGIQNLPIIRSKDGLYVVALGLHGRSVGVAKLGLMSLFSAW